MISIIIPTLNEEKYLPLLLKSIKKQDFRDYEVIVADAGSKDATRRIAREFGAKVVKGGIPAAGRNAGAKAAKGEFLFFLDADVVIPRHFLKNAYREMQRRYLDFATVEAKPLSDMVIDKIFHETFNLAVKLSQFHESHVSGVCILVTRRLFDRIEGFDESLKIAEDMDFAKRAGKFRPIRVLNSAHLMVSVRRMEKEGRAALIRKYLFVEMYRLFKGEVRHDLVEYEFGNFDQKLPQKKSHMKILLEKIRKLNKDLNKASSKAGSDGYKGATMQENIQRINKKAKSVVKSLTDVFSTKQKKKSNNKLYK